ncbi:MmcB family DNA repair protein [Ancylobacter pratisalsi]|uniref:MmcB family DNA repair protein n=1 Tax=Ancylobacter pratisalsi TaxID=1745854 RepID=A0A6P1YQ17_9HYPH|nr:MmcB family DNA repair protein [Ancylobacter pratisalsi]QIB33814.1 MmcB family DNA repair protein [Ancylobacter pratisalsi]
MDQTGLSPLSFVMPPDGRQSETARAIQRGALRYLAARGLVGVPEFVLASGRRADIAALDGRGEVWVVEIKSSVVDFRTDRKWTDYRMHCDRLFFAVGPDFPVDILPPDAGVMIADQFGAGVVREAPHHPMPGATRRAVTLRLARTAAGRLMGLMDPDGMRGIEL